MGGLGVTPDDRSRREEDSSLSAPFWENGQALGFPIQFDLVLRHLRQDMRDDWYFDCLQYEDLFEDANQAKRVIISLLQEWEGVYCGTQRVVRNVPKKGLGERYGLETDFFDRFIYQAICSFLIPYYDNLLEKWTFSGSHGLTQNRDASSFLSNILLSSVDRVMAERGWDYYRYVDDIRIIADSKLHARRALQDLIRQLRTVGMNINPGRTEILPPDTPDEKLAEYFPSQDSTTTAISQMWQSRSRRVVTRSVAYIFNVLTECIETGKTQSRQFRFAVNRISQIVESGLFDVSDSLSEKLLDTLAGTLSDHAVSTDQYCRLIAILDKDGRSMAALEAFLLAEEGAIHDWQNYNIWLLLGLRKYRSDALVDLADRKLQQDMRSGEAAAILIWLRCTDGMALIERSLKSFSASLPYQNARYLLISASKLPAEAMQPLYGLVSTALKGTGPRSIRHSNEDGLPFAVRERPDLLNLVDEVSEYD
jgi:hypothetical protein